MDVRPTIGWLALALYGLSRQSSLRIGLGSEHFSVHYRIRKQWNLFSRIGISFTHLIWILAYGTGLQNNNTTANMIKNWTLRNTSIVWESATFTHGSALRKPKSRQGCTSLVKCNEQDPGLRSRLDHRMNSINTEGLRELIATTRVFAFAQTLGSWLQISWMFVPPCAQEWADHLFPL